MTGNKYETAQGPDGKMYNVIDPSTGLYKDTQVETNIVGNREPKLIGGFNNSFSYKNFNLSFLFDIRLGGDIYNGTEYYLVTKGLSTKTINRESVSLRVLSIRALLQNRLMKPKQLPIMPMKLIRLVTLPVPASI